MFCPKCGKDGKDFKFCSYCGTEMPILEETPEVWSVGMACPHCGGTKLEGKNCAFCGAQLMLDVPGGEDEDSFEIPYGKFGRAGRLTLLDDHFTCVEQGLFKTFTITVPYKRITKIVYVHPGSVSDRGNMTIFWENAKDVLIPAGLQPGLDNCQLSVKEKYCEVLYHLCYVLKQLAAKAVEIVIEDVKCDPKIQGELDELSRVIDLDKYFEEFSPYRKQAWEALHDRAGVSPYRGKVLVHRAFDQRQRELYEHEPSLAIRDLNRAIKEKKRQEELSDQEFEKRQAQYRARNRHRR